MLAKRWAPPAAAPLAHGLAPAARRKICRSHSMLTCETTPAVMRYWRNVYSDHSFAATPTSAGDCRAQATIRAHTAGENNAGWPRPGRPSSPLTPPCRKRRSQRRTEVIEAPSSAVMTFSGRPSAAASTIAARTPTCGRAAKRCNCNRTSGLKGMRSGNGTHQPGGRPPVSTSSWRSRSIEIHSTTRLRTRCARSFAKDHTAKASPCSCGGRLAIRRILPTTRAPNFGRCARPPLRWASPAKPCRRYRASQRCTVSRCTPKRTAMPLIVAPRARAKTMRPRWRSSGAACAIHSRSACPSHSRLVLAIVALPPPATAMPCNPNLRPCNSAAAAPAPRLRRRNQATMPGANGQQ